MKQSAESNSWEVRTFDRVETLNLVVTWTKGYSNNDVVLAAPEQKHLPSKKNTYQPCKFYLVRAQTTRKNAILVLWYISYPKGRNHRNLRLLV